MRNSTLDGNEDEEEFLAGLRISVQQANAGQLTPLGPVLEKLRQLHEPAFRAHGQDRLAADKLELADPDDWGLASD